MSFLQENMLNTLQKHVEEEEKNWRQTLTEKDNEIDLLQEQMKTPQVKRNAKHFHTFSY